ncbi:MAG TPA: hypothetical protein EYO33_22150 [Phycisphaerales bacterium]|nr:hypothetical protein [Phycisphaerales bacterium]
MEVSETKLVNFAEKTQFDVTSTISYETFEAYSGASNALAPKGIELIYPDVSSLLESDGSWNPSNRPVFRFLNTKTSEIYESLADVPDLAPSDILKATKGVTAYVDAVWIPMLKDFKERSKEVKVFQLDPNQLLTVSSGFKVVLRRPL